MSDLKVTLIQSKLFWEDKKANLKMFASKIANIKEETDLIILPEMFTTGFTMNALELAEDMNGEAVKWMQKISRDKNCTICGSVIIAENNNYFNRMLWVNQSGVEFYDKRHLFRLAQEERTFSEGTKQQIFEINNWKIQPFICYDLRFPVWSRNTEDVDLQLFIANWPKKRELAWSTLLRARAIENLSYVIGVNRVGTDGNGFEYSGDSAAIHPNGDYLYKESTFEDVRTITLSKEELTIHRRKFQFYKDRDQFTINL
jgi:omega-amidase